MDENAKRRLVGAAVLVALMVIFVPMLVDREDDDQLGEPIVIPNPPAFDSRYDASVEPVAGEFDHPAPEPEATAPAASDAADLRPGVARPAPVEVERPPVKPAAPTPAPEKPATPAPRAPASAQPAPASRPPAVPADATSWVVQVASLSVADAANRLRDELRGKGYSAFVEQAEINGATFYRVRVGPESDRARADQMATAIGAETGGAPLVQQYR